MFFDEDQCFRIPQTTNPVTWYEAKQQCGNPSPALETGWVGRLAELRTAEEAEFIYPKLTCSFAH